MPKQPDQIIGSFVFREVGDGCVNSKFQHGDSRNCPFTESCKLITAVIPDDVFVGTYRTIWIEDNNQVSAELVIRRHLQNNSLFDLQWRNSTDNQIFYWGSAMLYEGFLIGAYWN